MKSKEIIELRQRLGVSMEKFGKILHVSHATVSKWESGKTQPHTAFQIQLDKLKRVVDEQEKREAHMGSSEYRASCQRSETRRIGELFVGINKRIEKLEKQETKLKSDLET